MKEKLKLPEWIPSDIFKINEIAIELTKKCNLECEHCGASSSPLKKELLGIPFLKELIIQLNLEKFKKIVITGGEPFLYLTHLKTIIEYCNKFNIELQIVTNGFWGKYPQNYFEVLKEFSNNKNATIVLSVDKIHNKYIPKKYIFRLVNFINEHFKINIHIYTIEFYQDFKFLEKISKLFPNVSIFSQPILMVGRAKNNENLIKTHRKKLNAENDDHPCHMVLYPYLSANKEWYICSNSSVINRNMNYAKIGKLDNPKNLNLFLRKHLSNNLFRFIRNIGPYKLIQEIQPELLSKSVTSICEVCIQVIQSNRTMNLVNNNNTIQLLNMVENIVKEKI